MLTNLRSRGEERVAVQMTPAARGRDDIDRDTRLASGEHLVNRITRKRVDTAGKEGPEVELDGDLVYTRDAGRRAHCTEGDLFALSKLDTNRLAPELLHSSDTGRLPSHQDERRLSIVHRHRDHVDPLFACEEDLVSPCNAERCRPRCNALQRGRVWTAGLQRNVEA